MYRMRDLFFGAIFLAGACGYRPVQSRLPDGAARVCIPLVENRTAIPGVAAALTHSLRLETQGSGLDVAASEQGVHRLRVVIVDAQKTPGMVEVRGGHLNPVENIWTIRADATLEDPAGKPIRGPRRFEVGGRSYAGGNIASDEALGESRRLDLQNEMAALIVEYMFQGGK